MTQLEKEGLPQMVGAITEQVAAVDVARPPSNAIAAMIWIADAHRDDGKRFLVPAKEKLTAFLELEAACRASGEFS